MVLIYLLYCRDTAVKYIGKLEYTSIFLNTEYLAIAQPASIPIYLYVCAVTQTGKKKRIYTMYFI